MEARVPRDARVGAVIGINWASSSFRALRIARDGLLLDEIVGPNGIASLDRAGMVATIEQVVARWPGGEPIYAAGMIGSALGWLEVPYAQAPAGLTELTAKAVITSIGTASVVIVPGVSCIRADGSVDVLRGEEVELVGLMTSGSGAGVAVLPGAHTKWVSLGEDRIRSFLTSIAGEMFDRLTGAGLLASIIEGEAADGPAFHQGLDASGAARPGLATSLFGARARVMFGSLARRDAASYLRGLLIGAELADARTAFPTLGEGGVTIVGNHAVAGLYVAALDREGIATRRVEAREACLRGFLALDRARSAQIGSEERPEVQRRAQTEATSSGAGPD